MLGVAVLSFMVFAASPSQADSLQSVANRLAKGLKRLDAKTKRIAVLSFSYHNGDVSSGSSYVAEQLTTLLVEKGNVEVVERALLDKAMSEIRLGMTGVIDSATTQKLGKILGVNAIVTGTLIDLENGKTDINARLIQTETGSILAAGMARIERTWDDLPRPPSVISAQTSREDGESHLHMSKLIPTHPNRPRVVQPVYHGVVSADPRPMEDSGQDVLTLTNEDLTPPLRYRGETDPEHIVNDLMVEQTPAGDHEVRMARRIYNRHPDAIIRGRALIAMGHLLERSGHPEKAAHAYQQVLGEFPEAPGLQTEARQRLDLIAPPPPGRRP